MALVALLLLVTGVALIGVGVYAVAGWPYAAMWCGAASIGAGFDMS